MNFDLTILNFFVPEADYAFGVLSVVDDPLRRALDALQRAVQTLQLPIQRRCRKAVRSGSCHNKTPLTFAMTTFIRIIRSDDKTFGGKF